METNTKVKRTQGEWKVIEQRSILEPFLLYADKRKIATMHWGVHSSYPETFEEVEANVKFICEAVTNYDKLKEDNERLKRIVTDFLEICKWIPKETFTNNGQAIFQNLLTAASEVIKL
jgi:hypothetical protein